MECELRRNRIRAGHVDECLRAWVDQVPALRRRFGFELVGAWFIDGSGELVWILGYDGPDGFEAADARYYASAERAALDPDPAQWFETSESVRMRPLPLPEL
jgi:hypothetical protein